MKYKSIKNSFFQYFRFNERKTTIKKEILGGIVTFLSMSYIFAVQPSMMSYLNFEEKIMPEGGIFLATVLSSFFGTMVMGIIANVPVSLAPGMGGNAFFVFTVCSILKLHPYEAMSAVLVSGWIYFIIAITPARKYISKAMPKNLKLAIGASIGLFIAFVGFQNSGIIQSDAKLLYKEGIIPKITTATSVKLGNFSNPLVILSIVVLIVMFVLHFLKIKGAIIISMVFGVVVMAICCYWAKISAFKPAFKLNKYEDQFSGFAKITGKSWTHMVSMLKNPRSYIAIFVFLYADFFSTTGTLFAIGESSGINKKEGEEWMTKANWSDALGTIAGASIGASTVTSYVESTTGTSVGSRTGFTSVITGLLFMATMILWPIMNPLMPIQNIHENFNNANESIGSNEVKIISVSPNTLMPITSPALILVGSLMLSQLKKFDWQENIDIPTLFITITMTVLTYSMTSGISAGVIMFVILNFFAGFKQFLQKKYSNKQLIVSNNNIIKLKHATKNKNNTEKKYWSRLNVTLTVMFVLGIIYFLTTILYLYK